jgi:signal transduction histidine kinase
VEALAQQSLRWLVLTSLVSRIVLAVPAVILTRGVLGARGDAVTLLAAGLIAFDGLLIVLAVRHPELLRARWLLAADLTLTATAVLAATVLLPAGMYLLPGRDALTGYAWGTVALWTALRGWRVGACLVGATAAVHLAMALLNGAVFDASGLANLAQRIGIATVQFLLTAAVVAVAYRGARATVAAGLRAGRMAERADALRSLHDTSLAELDALVLTTRRETVPSEVRLAEVTRRAEELSERWINGDVPGNDEAGLDERLRCLAADFGSRGLDVRVVGETPVGTLSDRPQVRAAILGAAREALTNVLKHADVGAATLNVRASADTVALEVVDRGRGFARDRESAGFGLDGSIRARMAEVGGRAGVRSAIGRGTRVRLDVPARVRPDGPPPETATAAIRWFPLVPLAVRVLSLPIIASKVGLIAPPQVHVVVVGLLVGNVLLIGALVRPGGDRLLRSRVFLVCDLAAAAGYYLLLAAVQPAGAVLTPAGDGAWLYVLCTVPFWLAAGGATVGLAVLLGALAVEGLAIGISDPSAGAADWSIAVLHVVQLVATTAYAALVIRMARRGFALARAESLRAGRESERVEVFADLHRRVGETWRAIAAAPDGVDASERLASIRAIAAATAADLRAALRQTRGVTGLPARLADLLSELRPHGRPVELVVTEWTGEPPPDVQGALVAATRRTLQEIPTGAATAPAVLRLTGSPVEAEVSLRVAAAWGGPGPDVRTLLASVGGRAEVSQTPRATRTRLMWSVS